MSIQIPDDFTPWDGGENPVPGKRVEIFCRLEGDMGRYEVEASASENLRWQHKERGGDIIAYRVIP